MPGPLKVGIIGIGQRVTVRLAKFVEEVIDGGRQSETPPFHP